MSGISFCVALVFQLFVHLLFIRVFVVVCCRAAVFFFHCFYCVFNTVNCVTAFVANKDQKLRRNVQSSQTAMHTSVAMKITRR